MYAPKNDGDGSGVDTVAFYRGGAGIEPATSALTDVFLSQIKPQVGCLRGHYIKPSISGAVTAFMKKVTGDRIPLWTLEGLRSAGLLSQAVVWADHRRSACNSVERAALAPLKGLVCKTSPRPYLIYKYVQVVLDPVTPVRFTRPARDLKVNCPQKM
ncbi:hypothetical protein EVAR_8762_1 [Eumeta japonica]|uniref:Uncharacterized protein n=1 Tax=Eumeta variegata TaxID=151549 RepID=A0A4C1TTQ5_EUMVA|nr:hypothetical protein EVAR_8762_1 [Eumeta japonica]